MSHDHGIKNEFVSLVKPIVFGTIRKKMLYWLMFGKEINIITDFSLFSGYWPSKNGSRDHDVKGEYISLTKPIVFGATGRKRFM